MGTPFSKRTTFAGSPTGAPTPLRTPSPFAPTATGVSTTVLMPSSELRASMGRSAVSCGIAPTSAAGGGADGALKSSASKRASGLQGSHVPPMCPSGAERGETRGHQKGGDGTKSEGLWGNRASCLGFPSSSISAASTSESGVSRRGRGWALHAEGRQVSGLTSPGMLQKPSHHHARRRFLRAKPHAVKAPWAVLANLTAAMKNSPIINPEHLSWFEPHLPGVVLSPLTQARAELVQNRLMDRVIVGAAQPRRAEHVRPFRGVTQDGVAEHRRSASKRGTGQGHTRQRAANDRRECIEDRPRIQQKRCSVFLVLPTAVPADPTDFRVVRMQRHIPRLRHVSVGAGPKLNQFLVADRPKMSREG